MTNIERMAKEAELADEFGRPLPAYPRRLAKFAALVAEETAKVCEGLWGIDGQFTADEFADAIRAKFAWIDGKDAAK